jgi:class 3 adenylate cyclase
MPTLPEGTVTLLFTDIEGSTRLLQELGGSYEQLLMEHRRLLRTCVQEHRGVVVDTQGDAFFVAFARAQDALAAAVATQRAHAAHDWNPPNSIRVRMAVHTGEPARVGEGLVGLAVHRAARICAAGHGGQILLSSTTRDIVRDDLPPGVALLDLGQHRLKDLDRPEGIVQVVAEGTTPVLAPLRTIDAQPAQATPFAGQEGRLAEAAAAAVAEPAEESGGSLAPLGALTRAAALDWRRYVPVGHARLANRLAGLGLSIHATARVATRADLQDELRQLGRAFVSAARDARDTDNLLHREDRSALERRLAKYRRYAHWDAQLRAADLVAVEIAALEALRETRREFEDEARKTEAKVRSVRARVFEARLDSAKVDDLVQELRPLREAVEALGARLGASYRAGVRAVERAAPLTGERRS